jgi:hypothetical protein
LPLTILGKGCARQAEEGNNFNALIFYFLITQVIEGLPVGPVFSQIILQVVKRNKKEVPIRCRSALFSAGYLKKIAPTLPQTLRNARSKSGAEQWSRLVGIPAADAGTSPSQNFPLWHIRCL